MSFSDYFDTIIAPASDELDRLLYDRKTDQYLCPSFYGEDGKLQSCVCRKCE